MDMETIMAYVRPELLVIIPILMFIGKAFKNSKLFHDEIIPFVLGVVSIVMCGLYVLAVSSIDGWQSALTCVFNIIVQGILLAGVSTWGHQCYKQATKLKESAEKE